MLNLAKTYPTLADWFSRPDRWTQNTEARDSSGQVVDSDSTGIASMCLGFAIDKIYGEKAQHVRELVLAEINRDREPEDRYSDIPSWNDWEDRKFKHIRQLSLKVTQALTLQDS